MLGRLVPIEKPFKTPMVELLAPQVPYSILHQSSPRIATRYSIRLLHVLSATSQPTGCKLSVNIWQVTTLGPSRQSSCQRCNILEKLSTWVLFFQGENQLGWWYIRWGAACSNKEGCGPSGGREARIWSPLTFRSPLCGSHCCLISYITRNPQNFQNIRETTNVVQAWHLNG